VGRFPEKSVEAVLMLRGYLPDIVDVIPIFEFAEEQT